jgi:hypothetical protein
MRFPHDVQGEKSNRAGKLPRPAREIGSRHTVISGIEAWVKVKRIYYSYDSLASSMVDHKK